MVDPDPVSPILPREGPPLSPPPPPVVPPPAPPQDKPPTLKGEWILIAAISGLLMMVVGLDLYGFPQEMARRNYTPLTLLAMAINILGNALWISMDRKRRGLEVGWWRFGVVFLGGPLVIILYLILEYKKKALYLVPLLLVIYINTVIWPLLVVSVLRHLGV